MFKLPEYYHFKKKKINKPPLPLSTVIINLAFLVFNFAKKIKLTYHAPTKYPRAALSG